MCKKCGRLIPYPLTYCTEHTPTKQDKADTNKHYDIKIRHERDAEYTAFYHSTEWGNMRSFILNKYNGLDLYAYMIHHKVIQATMVHHIIELKEDYSLCLEINNLIPLSDASHREINKLYKTQKEETQTILKSLLSGG